MFENIRILEQPKHFEVKYLSNLVFDMVDKNGRSHDDLGRFAKESSGPKEWGESFSEYSGKPEQAIDKLLKEKRGYVPKAIYKSGIGDIDFVWGIPGQKFTEKGYGIAHIIRRRKENGYDGEKFVKTIPSIIKNGTIYRDTRFKDRVYVETKDKSSTIRLDWDGLTRVWLVTAFYKKENKKG